MLEQQQQSLRPYDQPQGYLQPSWANGWASAPLAQASSAEQQMSSFVNLGLAGFVPGPNPSLPGWPSSGTPDAPTSPFPPVANFNYQQAIAQAAFRNLAAAIPPAQLPYGLPGVRPGAPDAPTDPYPAQAAASQQLALAALLGQMQAGFAAATPSGQSAATPPPFPDLAAQLSNPAALAAAAAANPWALMLAATAAAGATGALPPAAWRASHPNLDQHVAVESAMVEQSRGSSSDPDEVSEGSKSLVRKSHNRHGGLNHQQADTRGRDDSPDHNDNGSSRHRMETNEHAFGGRHKSHEVAGQAAVDNRRLKEPSPPTPTVAPVPPAPQPAAPAPAATADDCTSMPPPPPRPHTLDSTSGSGPISTASLEHIRALLGPQQWSSVRVTLLKQQQQFVQQLFELHKLSQVQKLLSAELMCADLMNVEPLPLPERCPSATGAANGPHVSWSGLPPPRRSSTVMPAAVSHPSTNQAPMDMDLPVGVESHCGGAVPTVSVGLEKRLQQDFAHLVNIPGPLRHKAGSASPDQANTGSGIGKEATGTASAQALLESLLPLQKEAWARPGVLRPQALRLCPDSGPTQSVSVVQPSMSNSEAGPTPIGMVNALEAAVLGSGPAHADPYSIPQRPGLASEPLHALHAQQAPYTQQVDMAAASKSSLPPTASLSGLPVVPAPIGRNLMEAAAALLQSAGGIPPLPLPQLAAAALMQSSAGMPMMGDICASSANQLDPHAAWFSRHYGAQNNMSSLTSQPPAGTISNPQTSMIPSMGGGPQPSASGRWWQDEAATFGDVAPSALTHTPAVGVSTGAGNKRSLSTKGPGASGAGNKKVRSEDPGDAPVDRGAFKAVRPRKARSKRGSNRLGPPGSANGHTYNNGGHHSSPSDSDASHEGGSCVGGSAAVGPAGMIRPRNGVAKAPVTLPPPAAAPTRSGSLGLPLTMSAAPNSNSHDDNSLTGREDKSAAGILLSLCTAAVTDGHTVSKAQKRSNTPSPTRTVDRGGMGPISGAVGSPLVGQARA